MPYPHRMQQHGMFQSAAPPSFLPPPGSAAASAPLMPPPWAGASQPQYSVSGMHGPPPPHPYLLHAMQQQMAMPQPQPGMGGAASLSNFASLVPFLSRPHILPAPSPIHASCLSCNQRLPYPMSSSLDRITCPHCHAILSTPDVLRHAEETHFYDVLQPYKAHFNQQHSALVWLSSAKPTRTGKLAVPRAYRWPKSTAGKGGYADAFVAMGLQLRRNDTASGHWHCWYVDRASVPFGSLQAGLVKRWKESPRYSAEAAGSGAEDEDGVAAGSGKVGEKREREEDGPEEREFTERDYEGEQDTTRDGSAYNAQLADLRARSRNSLELRRDKAAAVAEDGNSNSVAASAAQTLAGAGEDGLPVSKVQKSERGGRVTSPVPASANSSPAASTCSSALSSSSSSTLSSSSTSPSFDSHVTSSLLSSPVPASSSALSPHRMIGSPTLNGPSYNSYASSYSSSTAAALVSPPGASAMVAPTSPPRFHSAASASSSFPVLTTDAASDTNASIYAPADGSLSANGSEGGGDSRTLPSSSSV